MERPHILAAILPCNDVHASQDFYARLGFRVRSGNAQYLMLADDKGGEIHLQPAVEGWVQPNRNPFGLYLYAGNVDELASLFPGEILGRVKHPEHKSWGMYEFAVSDPDGTLVRVGKPSLPDCQVSETGAGTS